MTNTVDTVFEELESPFARREYFKALVAGGVLPEMAPGALGGSIKSALHKAPAAMIESFPESEAYQRLLDNIDAQLAHTRSVGRTLLVLFTISVVFTLGFVAWVFAHGDAARDIRTWISALPTAAIGVWNRGNRQAAQLLLRDSMRLAQARR
jgi:hypothetical protein